MSADSISLIIAGCGGFVLGSLIWMHVAGLFITRIRRRTEKETWAAASRFYARKGVRL